jgi:hypothetical protein
MSDELWEKLRECSEIERRKRGHFVGMSVIVRELVADYVVSVLGDDPPELTDEERAAVKSKGFADAASRPLPQASAPKEEDAAPPSQDEIAAVLAEMRRAGI